MVAAWSEKEESLPFGPTGFADSLWYIGVLPTSPSSMDLPSCSVDVLEVAVDDSISVLFAFQKKKKKWTIYKTNKQKFI